MDHYGIDIASFQHYLSDGTHVEIDYEKVVAALKAKSGGAQPFVYVKITDSNNYTNSDWMKDVIGFLNAGARVRVYLFLHANIPASDQLAYFAAEFSKLSPNFASQLSTSPLWVDTEEGSVDQGYTWANLAVVAQDISSSSEVQGFYYNKDTLNNIPGLPYGKGRWFADPSNTSPDVSRDVWQTGQQPVDGIVTGNVDMNQMTDATFQHIFGTEVTPVVVPVVEPTVTVTQPKGIVDMWPNVSQGNATPEETKVVQSLLVAQGYDLTYPGCPPAGIDGQWGGRTQASLLHFQFTKFGKSGTDGIVGKDTIGALLGVG